MLWLHTAVYSGGQQFVTNRGIIFELVEAVPKVAGETQQQDGMKHHRKNISHGHPDTGRQTLSHVLA